MNQMNKEEILDGYEQFFQLFAVEEFIKFGLDKTITVDQKKAKQEWTALVNRIENKDDNLYIRNMGQKGNKNDTLKKMYEEVMGIPIKFDPNNNLKPTQRIEKLTGYKKKEKHIQLSGFACIWKH